MLTNLHFTITPRQILRVCLYSFSILFFLNILTLIARFGFEHGRVFGFASLLNFKVERNIPMAFTFLLFIFASIICMMIFRVERKQSSKWVFLSVLFLILGIDEFVAIHERFIEPVRELLSTSGFFYHAWIIPYSVLVVVIFLYLNEWLRKLPKRTKTGLIFSAFLYLCGVFVMEGLGGWYHSGDPERLDLVLYTMITIEDTLEILGLTVFIYFSADYLFSYTEYMQIRLHSEQHDSQSRDIE